MARNRGSFKFTDNTGRVGDEINRTSKTALTKALLVLEGQTKLLTRVDTGDLRDSWTHQIDEQGDQLIGQIGSPLDYAIYREFGTGEFAENGAGRKGGWWYKKPDGSLHFTMGSKPDKSLRTAFQKEKGRVETILANELGGMG